MKSLHAEFGSELEWTWIGFIHGLDWIGLGWIGLGPISFIYMPPISHMDWIGLGHRVDGLDWIGFRKLDPCPTLIWLRSDDGRVLGEHQACHLFVGYPLTFRVIYTVFQKNGHPFCFCDYSVCCSPILKIFGKIVAKKICNKTHISKFVLMHGI